MGSTVAVDTRDLICTGRHVELELADNRDYYTL